jgi:1-acyl-sn-glycerol-3-phosphate acyltransferase
VETSRELGPLARVGAAIMVALVRACFRVRVVGIDRVPSDASVVLAANHVSALDGVILGLVVWQRRRRATRFLTAAEFFDKPVFGALLRAYRQIPLRRGERDAAALARAIATVEGGALFGIFPEGKVNAEAEGPLQRGRTGVARIALAAGGPVVAVGIAGTERRWPRSGLRLTTPPRTRITLAFGAPLSLTGDPSSPEDLQRETHRVMDSIAEQVERARRD